MFATLKIMWDGLVMLVRGEASDHNLGITDYRASAPKPKPPSITCPHCKRTSYHPEDIRHSYCANCNVFWG